MQWEDWRRRRLAAFLVAYAAVDAVSILLTDRPHRVLVAVLAACSLLVLTAHRSRPLPGSTAAFGFLLLAQWLHPESTTLQFLGMLVVFTVVGLVNRGRDLLLAAVAGLVWLVYATLLAPNGGGWPDFLLSTVICEGLLVAGRLLAGSRHEIRRMRAAARLADEVERHRTRDALVEERARIARELHDVVSHGLTVVVVQAQAARGALPAQVAAAATRHLDAVEDSAREALAEMRRMLGLLQLDGPDQDAPLPPSPGLHGLGALVERAREAGVPVTAELPGEDAALGPGLELAVYRIVQEALTNVVKHAPGAATAVLVRVCDRVEVVVRSDASPTWRWAPASEHPRGLLGMSERVHAYGGSLRAAATPEGGFEVRAELPVTTDPDRARVAR